MKHLALLDIALNLFDGAAAGGAAGGGEGAAAPAQGDTGENQAGKQMPGSDRRGKTGGLAKVVYGKQPESAQPSTAEQNSSDAGSTEPKKELTLEEKRAKFRELVDTEYKDIYTQEFQSALDRRFKATRETEERLRRQQPILDMLMSKYQIEDGNVERLAEAIEKDEAYWASAAESAGMSVDQYRTFEKLQRENAAFKRAQEQTQARQAAEQQVRKWQDEGAEVKKAYPTFDFSSEAKNPQFLAMLKSGVPVRHAYEVVHIDDIKTVVAKSTAQQTEKKVVDDIRAKGNRPTENGISIQSGITIKSDVSKLTPKDREEIARRVARGEVIKF